MKRMCLLFSAAVLCVGLCACRNTRPAPMTIVTKSSSTVPSSTNTTVTESSAVTDETQKTSHEAITYTSSLLGTTTTAITTKPFTSSLSDSGVTNEIGDRIVEIANGLLGTPFSGNGIGPDSFNNPSFVAYCYKQVGITVARKASAIYANTEEVELQDIQPGDILVFSDEQNGQADFVAIYIGKSQFIACNCPDDFTRVQGVDKKYWGPRLIGVRRPR